jgi:hypothetical protein
MDLNKSGDDKLSAPDPSGKQVLYWHSKLKGLGVLSGKTARKTFVVQHKLKSGLTGALRLDRSTRST